MTTTPHVTLTLDKNLAGEALDKIRENFSAIVVAGKFLWLGGDEGTQIDRMTLDNKGNYGEHTRFDLASLLPGQPAGGDEIDIEGLDEDQGYLWLIGSHSKKRKKAEGDKTAQKNRDRLGKVEPDPLRHTLARVPLAAGQPVKSAGSLTAARLRNATDGGDGDELSERLRADNHLGRFWEIPSKDNGIDIEGLAVTGNRVFAGLRGPVLRGWAVVLEFEVQDAGPGSLAIKGAMKKHLLHLGGLGVRELAIRHRDLYILAGPTMDLDGPVTLYLWPNALDNVAESVIWSEDDKDRPRDGGPELHRVLDVPYGTGKDHAEGIAIVEQGSTARLLVCYDSPADGRLVNGPPAQIMLDTFELATPVAV